MSDTPPNPVEYPSLDRAKWYVITARGAFALRFGPYDGPTVGKVMAQAAEENIKILVTGDCGPEFDWQAVRDLSCAPPEPASLPEPNKYLELLLGTARILRARLKIEAPDSDDLWAMNEVLKPFDPSPEHGGDGKAEPT